MIIGVSGSYQRDTEIFAKLLAKRLEFKYKNIPLNRFFREKPDKFHVLDRIAYHFEQYQHVFDFLEEQLESLNTSEEIVLGVTPLELLSHLLAQTAEGACVIGSHDRKVKKVFDDITMTFYVRAFELTNQYYNFQVHFQPGLKSYLTRKGIYRTFIYQEHQNAILTGLFANCLVCTIPIPRQVEDVNQQVEKIASDFLLFREKRDEQMREMSNLKNIN